MKIHIPGYTTLVGSPLAILLLIRDAQFFQGDTPTDLDEFIRTMQQTFFRCFGFCPAAEGETVEEKAKALLEDLAKHNIIEIEEGE